MTYEEAAAIPQAAVIALQGIRDKGQVQPGQKVLINGGGGSVATLFQILLLGPWIRTTTGKKIRLLAVQPNRKDLVFITELCEAGKVVPVIDRRYPLSEVPEALRYLGQGHAKGKVVITVK